MANVYYRDKEDEVKRLQEVNKNQLMQSEKSLEEFKLQVEKNQTRMYDEMKQQVREKNQEGCGIKGLTTRKCVDLRVSIGIN